MSIFRRIGDTLGNAVNGAKGGMASGLGAAAREFGGQAPAPVPGVGHTPPPVGGFMAQGYRPPVIGGIASVFNARFGQQTGGFTAPGFSSPGMGYRPPTLNRPVKPEAKTPATGPGSGATNAAGFGSSQWATLINEEAGRYADAPDLAEVAQAMVELESQGRADAQGVVVTSGQYAGQRAQGLGQIMPGNYPGVNLLDPRTNIQKMLEMLYSRYKQWGNWDSAVASYFGAIDGQGRPTTMADDNGTTGVQYVAIVNKNRQAIRGAAQPAGGRAPVNAEGTAFPVQGYAGQVQLHWGEDPGAADLFAAAGTPVAAMRGGRVTSAGYSDIGGWNVTIQGEDGLTYYYAHLQNQPSVQAGQSIASGAIFGQVGDTGNAKGTGAHLHLGIGYGIQSGTGPRGGSGINFNATEYLQRVLGMTARR